MAKASPTAAAATEAEVTLTYLATGFDWGASYVARIAEDGKTLDLFAWLTVANSNGESFADANLSALAGTLNIEQDFDELVEAPPQPQLRLACFPTGSGRTWPVRWRSRAGWGCRSSRRTPSSS